MSEVEWARQGTDANFIRRLMSRVSLRIRLDQYTIFINILKPNKLDKILDVGPTTDESLFDSNFFEEVYPYKNKLYLASIEDCRKVVQKYKLAGFTKIFAGEKIPFKAKSFRIVVSWATLEHVGSRQQQKVFIKEIARVGKRFFITTPDKDNLYEPHSTTLFLHWLPAGIFRIIIKTIGKHFWSLEKNLNIFSFKEAIDIVKDLPGVKVKKYKIFGIIPSNLIIYK